MDGRAPRHSRRCRPLIVNADVVVLYHQQLAAVCFYADGVLNRAACRDLASTLGGEELRRFRDFIQRLRQQKNGPWSSGCAPRFLISPTGCGSAETGSSLTPSPTITARQRTRTPVPPGGRCPHKKKGGGLIAEAASLLPKAQCLGLVGRMPQADLCVVCHGGRPGPLSQGEVAGRLSVPPSAGVRPVECP